MFEGHPKWNDAVKREKALYYRGDDIRSDFFRDYTRILHCTAYRRLKHKTQVFFATKNDHICTRIEHVNHVTSVSYNIANFLGLNTELTNAIAVGHDLGHAPFGHQGEIVLKKIVGEKEIDINFWHEKNSLRIIDKTETIEDPQGCQRNLNLTYAVRDGIVCHCGEIDQNGLVPRDQSIDLNTINKPNEYLPYTWEGCVVKIADKISYLGRDIEDALALRILDRSQLRELVNIRKKTGRKTIKEINNTVLIHDFIVEICRHSTPEKGIMLSDSGIEMMNSLKEFNYKNIYLHKRLNVYKKYADLIIRSIFDVLYGFFDADGTVRKIDKYKNIYPRLTHFFKSWLIKFGSPDAREKKTNLFKNEILYDISKEKDYIQAITDFVSGMTDAFAIKMFEELTTF